MSLSAGGAASTASAQDAAPAILIEGARKSYGSTAVGRADAVSDISLSVSRGAIHGLLGPNGAGKTTTLKMLLGLVRPTAGRFEILGLAAEKPGARAHLGFLPEQPYFPAQLSADEALGLFGQLAGLKASDIARQAPELLARVGLENRGGTALARFSRGMLQRFGLAQALIGSPSVLVLDEPASGLDPVGQRDIRNLMLALKADGVSILLSSHQLSEVEAVCDEVTIVNRGAVAARGRIDDLLNVQGRMSVRVRGDGELPQTVKELVDDVAVDGGVRIFSIPDVALRRVVDALDEVGWRIESIVPKRESLEDYFARLLEAPGGGEGR